MGYQQFAYYYDRLMEEMPYAEWMRFAQMCWDKYGIPQTVVDLGCGTGNISIPLAQTGLRVTGIDLSSDMLAIAREKLDHLQQMSSLVKGGEVRWLQQDLREWELPWQVDSVISFCDCLNYVLEEQEIEQAFRRTYEGLTANGLFIFDVHTQHQLLQYAAEQPFVLNEEHIAYIWTCDLDESRCIIEHELTIFARESRSESQSHPRSRSQSQTQVSPSDSSGGQSERFRRIRETHIQRAYSLEWLMAALERAGFRHVERFADFQFQPPTDASQRAFFVALK